MHKELFVVSTHYQMIMAIQICSAHRRKYKDYYANILLFDYARSVRIIAERLSETSIFDKVTYREINPYKGKSLVRYVSRVMQCIYDVSLHNANNSCLCKEFDLVNESYDEVFFYSITNFLMYSVFDYFQQFENVKFNRFEEGIFSYNNVQTKENVVFLWRAIQFLRKKGLIRRKNILDKVVDYYCLIPELYKNDNGYSIHKIPQIDLYNRSEIDKLNYVFGVDKVNEEYSPEIIYLASSIDLGDGGNKKIHEEEIVKRLIKKYGSENIFVKKHPRDNRKIFENLGVKTNAESNAPWEVIQANLGLERKKFFTVASGSVIGASVLMGVDIQGYLLFPMVKGINKTFDKYCNDSVQSIIDRFHELGMFEGIKVLNSLDEV